MHSWWHCYRPSLGVSIWLQCNSCIVWYAAKIGRKRYTTAQAYIVFVDNRVFLKIVQGSLGILL